MPTEKETKTKCDICKNFVTHTTIKKSKILKLERLTKPERFTKLKVNQSQTNSKKIMTKKLSYNDKARIKSGEYKESKIQCLICHCWYYQVGSHVVQRHNMTCKEYRELYNMPLKRGIQPDWLRKIRKKSALKHGTYKNNLLNKGKATRYKDEDKRTKKSYYWTGKRTQIKQLKNNFNYYN